MDHVRVATYKVTKGTAKEVADLAEAGMLAIFRKQPGFVRYGLAELDDGRLISISVWETHDEAEAAVGQASSWVADNIADRIALDDNHVGDFLFDAKA
jgi:heme-degrading monooxygenase HmoA